MEEVFRTQLFYELKYDWDMQNVSGLGDFIGYLCRHVDGFVAINEGYGLG